MSSVLDTIRAALMRTTVPIHLTRERTIHDVDRVVDAISSAIGGGVDNQELTRALLDVRFMQSVHDQATALLALFTIRRK